MLPIRLAPPWNFSWGVWIRFYQELHPVRRQGSNIRASELRPQLRYIRSLPLTSPWASSPDARPKDVKTSES